MDPIWIWIFFLVVPSIALALFAPRTPEDG